MRTRFILLGILALAAAGCGGSAGALSRSTDPAAARAALTDGLEAWRAGRRPAELQERKPVVHFGDTDWQDGLRLVDFLVADTHEEAGAGVVCRATLTLEGPGGRPVQKVATYHVEAGSTVSIVRSDD